jgi:restriction system protein
MSVWLSRGGEKGRFEVEALKRGLSIVDWIKIGNLSLFEDKAELKSALIREYTEVSATKINRWIPQIWYFRTGIVIGDLVIMPMKYKPWVRIGEVIGNYEFITEDNQPYKHIRKTKWYDSEIARDDLDYELINSLFYHGTICKIKAESAEERIRELL